MIIKIKDYKDGNFTTISNNLTRDNSISLTARGLMAYMLGCSEDWNFTQQGLEKATNSTRTTIENAIKELEEAGYVIKSQNRSKGKFGSTNWTISETPDLRDNEPFGSI